MLTFRIIIVEIILGIIIQQSNCNDDIIQMM